MPIIFLNDGESDIILSPEFNSNILEPTQDHFTESVLTESNNNTMNFDNFPERVDASSNIKKYSISSTYLLEADHNIQNTITLQDNSTPMLLETGLSLNILSL